MDVIMFWYLDYKLFLIPELCKAWNKNNVELAELFEKYSILDYIDISMGYYETMGTKGVILDLTNYLKELGVDIWMKDFYIMVQFIVLRKLKY